MLHLEKTTARIEFNDVRRAVESHLAYYPRLRQRVVAAPFFKGRPFWATEAHFDMDRHLHERALPGDGSMMEFDAVCSELACGHLDRLHPLWDMTLVHGLQGGRQAVIIRVHHAVTDGTGAISSLTAFTSETPGGPITAVPVAGAFGPPVSRMRLLVALADEALAQPDVPLPTPTVPT